MCVLPSAGSRLDDAFGTVLAAPLTFVVPLIGFSFGRWRFTGPGSGGSARIGDLLEGFGVGRRCCGFNSLDTVGGGRRAALSV